MRNWRVGKVGDLLEGLESGISVNGYDRAPAFNERAVLKVNAVSFGVFNPDSAKPIAERDNSRAKCNPRRGQIIISRSNTPDLVGACALVTADYPYRFLPDKLWQTMPRKNFDLCIEWLFYVLSSSVYRRKISNLATGSSGSMKNITKNKLLSLPILTPDFSTQKAIARILQTWDTAIEKTEALIAAKERQFDWLVTRIINNSGNKKILLSDCIFEISRRNKGCCIDRVLSVTNHSGFVLPEDQFKRRVASADLSNYKIINKGEYAYNPSRINVGSIARLDMWDNGVLSPMYTAFNLDNAVIDSDYFLHWLKSSEAKQRIKKSAQGSVRAAINFKNLSAISISLPELRVQQNIANILNTAKQEIKLLKKLADQYRTQKRGLMQKLLTGQWQIKKRDVA